MVQGTDLTSSVGTGDRLSHRIIRTTYSKKKAALSSAARGRTVVQTTTTVAPGSSGPGAPPTSFTTDLFAAQNSFVLKSVFNLTITPRDEQTAHMIARCEHCKQDFCQTSNPLYDSCMGSVVASLCKSCRHYNISTECDGLVHLHLCPGAVGRKNLTDYVADAAMRRALIGRFVSDHLDKKETQLCNKYCALSAKEKNPKTVYFCKDSGKLAFGPSPTEFNPEYKMCTVSQLGGYAEHECEMHVNCDGGYYCASGAINVML